MRKNISILVSLLILSLTACSDKGQYFEESGSVFHTSYHIKYKAKQILTDKIDSELQRFNLSLNPFNPNSTIAKVNNNEDVEVTNGLPKYSIRRKKSPKNQEELLILLALH